MALKDKKTINPMLRRTLVQATTDISEYLIVNYSGGVCNATDIPAGTVIDNVLTGREVTVIPDYESSKVTTGGAVTAGDEIISDASGKAIPYTVTGVYVLGRALSTSTGADQQINYMKLPVYYK